MAGYDDCIAAIRSVDESLTDGEIEKLVSELQNRQKVLLALGEANNLHEAAMKAADQIGKEHELAGVLLKRQQAENLIKFNDIKRNIETNWAKDVVTGIRALLMGSNKKGVNARESVKAAQIGLHNQYLAGFEADLIRSGLKDAWLNPDQSFHFEVAQVVRALSGGGVPPAVSQDAAKLGQIVSKWLEVSRLNTNKAGGYVGKLADYMFTQSHDPLRIRMNGGEKGDAWIDYMMRNLDWARMGFDPTDVKGAREFLQKEYNRILAGNFEQEGAGISTGLPSSLAKKVSAERVFHFADAKAAFDYNATFGKNDFREAILNTLRRSAQNTALMQKLGSNPGDMLERIFKDQFDRLTKADPAAARELAENKPLFEDMLKNLDGRINAVGNHQMAALGASVRAVEGFKLGSMIFSQLGDIPIYGAMARASGGSLIGSMADRIAGVFKGRRDLETRAFAASLGVFFDHFSNLMHAQHVPEGGVPGWLSKGSAIFQRLTGGPWWQDAARVTAGLAKGHEAAVMAETVFRELPERFRSSLEAYGIDEGRWEIMRQHGLKQGPDGRMYLVPENMKGVPDVALEGLKRGDGPRAYDKAREDLESKLYNYYADQISYLAMEPDANTRRLINSGTIRGTWKGEFARALWQFKGFTFAYIQKVIGTLLEADTVGQGGKNLFKGKGDMAGLAGLVAASTAFGYMSLNLKDIIKNREPRDATEHPGKVLLAALAQGGGLGIYGDFLFGEANRYGGGVTQTIMGPAVGDAIQLGQMTNELIHGDSKAADWVRFAVGHVPNLWYTKTAFDMLVAYKIYEALNPGYLARMEQRMQKENGQRFILRPQ